MIESIRSSKSKTIELTIPLLSSNNESTAINENIIADAKIQSEEKELIFSQKNVSDPKTSIDGNIIEESKERKESDSSNDSESRDSNSSDEITHCGR